MRKFILAILCWYKKKWLVRIVTIVGFTYFLIWLCTMDVSIEWVYILVGIGFIEYMTLNLIFDREMHAAHILVKEFFPDKNSIGNKAGYVLLHLVYTSAMIYMLYLVCTRK